MDPVTSGINLTQYSPIGISFQQSNMMVVTVRGCFATSGELAVIGICLYHMSEKGIGVA